MRGSWNSTLTKASVVEVLFLFGCAGHRPSLPWPVTAGEGAVEKHAEVETLGTGYDRQHSRVLARRVARATRANLDYAAYARNGMTLVALDSVPPEIVPTAAAAAHPFDGLIESMVTDLRTTPLSATEQSHPLAFALMVDALSRTDIALGAGLEDVRDAVRAESWGGAHSVQHIPQEITLAFVHHPKDAPAEFWVEVEFQPWARLFDPMPDPDGDGYPELYGKVIPAKAPLAALRWIEETYMGVEIDAGAVRTWANELASYWYPSYNTDLMEIPAGRWPLADTEPEVVAELGGTSYDGVTVALRGKPNNTAIYTVLLVSGAEEPGPETGARVPGVAITATAVPGERRVTTRIGPALAQWQEELQLNGQGSWASWENKVKPWHHDLKRQLQTRPKKLKALEGKDGYLFFRNSVDYVVGGDLQKQPVGKNPFPAIVEFKDFLAEQGIDFLLVPVPTKVEVFPDKALYQELREGERPILNPAGRRFLTALGDAGVEVVDLLPVFLDSRSDDSNASEPLYQPQDTHWTARGISVAAAKIAERVRGYSWHLELGEAAIAYKVQQVVFKQHGDLVSRMAAAEQRRFSPQELVGQQVLTPDGQRYEDDPTSPIVLLGDSFTGVYQRTGCEGAGISAHLARELGLPIDLVMSYGGGPNVRKKMLRRGIEALRQKRLVIWMFAARDLFNYWEDWAPLDSMNAGN